MKRAFVTRSVPGSGLDRLRAACEVDVWEGALPPAPDELRERVRDADGLLCMVTDRVDGALLDAAPRLRAIANYAVGTDNIDLAACAARGIPVGNTPDVLTDATADLAFALLLAAARRLPEGAAAARAGEWRTWEASRWLGESVAGAALGIVGMGRIGRAVARRAAGFDMDVRRVGVELEGLEELDFLSLHCPLTPQTRGLIDAAALARMKPTAILVNTARGPVVDTNALLAALEQETIAAAALDVTDPEPLPASHPLYAQPRCLIIPHLGSATRAARARMADLSVDNLLAALEGRPMPHPVGG